MGDHIKDGEAAKDFIRASAYLWQRAEELFPTDFAKKEYEMLISG
jgi:hypothetical protein